jgi:signal peptidase I
LQLVSSSEPSISPAGTSPQPPAEPSAPRGPRLLREIVETALITAILFLLVNAATGRFKIDGNSMEPNLHHAEYVIVDRVSYRLGAPQRGDVVVFTRDGDPKDYIKRVIGLPGETIAVSNGTVYIDGQLLNEPYVAPAGGAYPARRLDTDEYFVMGDNRGNSTDSRTFGPIRPDGIVGRAWIVYWPPAEWAVVPGYTYAAGN